MQFEQSTLDGKIVPFSLLEHVMHDRGFVRGGQWDWERVTYDLKMNDGRDVYYLRVQGIVVAGEIEQPDARIRLKSPLLGKHYYPHGVEYNEDFPEKVVRSAAAKIDELEKLIEQVKEDEMVKEND